MATKPPKETETMQRKIDQFQQMATEMVGDNKSPNLFFVSVEGVIITVTRDFNLAYGQWSELPRNVETALEDRKWGTIATTEPDEDGSTVLTTVDDSDSFRRAHKIAA